MSLIPAEIKKIVGGFTVEELLKNYTLILDEVAVNYLKITKHGGILQGYNHEAVCNTTFVWDLAGKAATDANGQVTLRMNNYLCLAHFEPGDALYLDNFGSAPTITNKPWFVATPRSVSPAILTTSQILEPLAIQENIFP